MLRPSSNFSSFSNIYCLTLATNADIPYTALLHWWKFKIRYFLFLPSNAAFWIHFCSLELQKRSKDLAHKIALEEAVLRRSTRVRAPPRENPAKAFLKYVNKWKED